MIEQIDPPFSIRSKQTPNLLRTIGRLALSSIWMFAIKLPAGMPALRALL
jgi:hypothetical protein